MCSLYFLEYDCGCIIQEADAVPSANCPRLGKTCPQLKTRTSRREGYNCPAHEHLKSNDKKTKAK